MQLTVNAANKIHTNTAANDRTIPPVVREYELGDTTYIVSATSKAGATEDAAAKVRRLLRKEINGNISGNAV